tara:strand:- start:20 stop:1042 length:1023 start_codon:yes stop_codon:yes gene_type:complete
MSVFGPNQVGEVAIGNAVAAETGLSTFISGASDKELQVVDASGAADIAAGKAFKVMQASAGSIGGYEFSDEVDPSKIESITVAEYTAELGKSVQVDIDATVKTNATYEVMIKLRQPAGSVSIEDFEIIAGSFVVNGDAPSGGATDVKDGIVASLNAALFKLDPAGKLLAVVSVDGDSLSITGLVQAGSADKDAGEPVDFMVIAKCVSNTIDPVTSLYAVYSDALTAATTQEANPGNGTGKLVSNYEWFVKGSKYSAYRTIGYPANFDTPYQADRSAKYNVIDIAYFSERGATLVERQHKVLSIAVEDADGGLADNAATNDVLARLRTIAPAVTPADLPLS